MLKSNIFLIEKNLRGAWVVYGILGIRQYYYYTKAQAKKDYLKRCQNILINK